MQNEDWRLWSLRPIGTSVEGAPKRPRLSVHAAQILPFSEGLEAHHTIGHQLSVHPPAPPVDRDGSLVSPHAERGLSDVVQYFQMGCPVKELGKTSCIKISLFQEILVQAVRECWPNELVAEQTVVSDPPALKAAQVK